jgi:uncharacterized membrane protein YgdD (TMEM256/DUF423 family)
MSKWAYVLTGLAALSGAAGVMESAAAAHLISDPLLKTSADFLLVNAAAVIAIGAVAVAGTQRKHWLLVAATTLLAGSLLFCGELSVHVFLGRRILPLAAPIGGALTILGWLIAAIAAFASMFQHDRSR